MDVSQLTLFPEKEDEELQAQLSAPLTLASPLSAAIGAFESHMLERALAQNTIKAFLADLRLLAEYVGSDKALGAVHTQDLKRFLHYLRHERGVPCTPKSSARRLTTMKVFFAWLAEDRILPRDPAAPIAHERARSPLPKILHEGQVEQLLSVTRGLRDDEDKPDARPHLLVTLLLHTGLKKGECMGISLSHIDVSDRSTPVLHVRYYDPKKAHKERKLALPEDFTPTLEQYLAEYRPKERLFECTARNLEYVLTSAAELSGLDGLSFEGLRMTCAVRDFKAGMPSEELREKLGLSKVAWREKEKQIEALASAPV